MKFSLCRFLKELVYVILFAAFVMVLQYFSSESEGFWYIVLFFLTMGNVLFSSEIETFLNYLKASFSFQLSLKKREKKFKKLESKSKKRRSKVEVKINRACNYIMYNVFVAAIPLIHGLSAKYNLNILVVLMSTGIVLLLVSVFPLFLTWIFSKTKSFY